jgi:hypothetical protein
MLTSVKNIVLIPSLLFLSFSAGLALAQENTVSANARTLNKQEVLDLISNKKIIYPTAKAAAMSSATEGRLETTFTKTEESGGTLIAYSKASSSSGKWSVDDNAKLVRQYDNFKWGDKPFRASIVEKNGKYFVRFGASEDHEIVAIE